MTTSRTVRRIALLTVIAVAPMALLATNAQAQGSAAGPEGSTAQVPASRAAIDDALFGTTSGSDQSDAQPGAAVQRRLTAAQRSSAAAGALPVSVVGVVAQAAAPTCAITGIVWNDSSQDGLKTPGEGAIEGSTVVLRWDSTTVLASQTTGSDGLYKFDGLQCGTYDVGFTLPSGYSWTTPLAAGGTDDSKATDPGASFLDGVSPQFTVGPNQLGTRRATAADAVQATYVETNIDAGMFRTGSGTPARASGSTPAGSTATSTGTGTKDAAQQAAAGGLAYTGTPAQNLGWTGAGLLAAGVVMVAATSSGGTRRARAGV